MPDNRLHVYYLPQHVDEQDLAGSTVVVIDALRATTTICQALASGARDVVPFLEIDEALAAARKRERADYVLGGERRGGKIPGFDLGNSPSEYTPEAVRGRRVLLTTTNGTRALHHARLARRIVIGSFLNLSAVAASIKDEPVNILCAGTDGAETGEDILFAGGLVHKLCCSTDHDWQLNDSAALAERKWNSLINNAQRMGRTLSEHVAFELKDTPGGRNLLGIGLDQDLVNSAQIDLLDIVPELDVREWRITVSSNEMRTR